LFAAAWLALCPWHLVFSRWALQGIFVPLLLLIALAGLYGWEQRKSWGLTLFGAGLGWLFYAYSGAQPFVLAWGVCLVAVYRKRLFTIETWKSWQFLLAAALFVIPVAPTIAIRLAPHGAERIGRVGIWTDPDVKSWQIPMQFAVNYIKHFDPRFLFISGDAQPRHGVPGLGQLVLADMILLPIGLVWSFRRREPLRGALLAAFLCGPIPASLTREGLPHALRSFAMVVPAVAWSGYAMAAGAEWIGWKLRRANESPLRSRAIAAILAAALFVLAGSGVSRYWRQSVEPLVQTAFEGGQREAWATLAREHRRGQRIWINGYLPYSVYYQLFFFRISPKTVGPRGPGTGDFIYYNPSGKTLDQLRNVLGKGDWLLFPVDASELAGPEGVPFISEADAARAGELWVVLEQKP
jgi:hypothetical protein